MVMVEETIAKIGVCSTCHQHGQMSVNFEAKTCEFSFELLCHGRRVQKPLRLEVLKAAASPQKMIEMLISGMAHAVAKLPNTQISFMAEPPLVLTEPSLTLEDQQAARAAAIELEPSRTVAEDEENDASQQRAQLLELD